MAHFAYVENGLVKAVHRVNNLVIMDENDLEKESLGQVFLSNLFSGEPENWVQCSFNGNFRGIFPFLNCSYLLEEDVFVLTEGYDEVL